MTRAHTQTHNKCADLDDYSFYFAVRNGTIEILVLYPLSFRLIRQFVFAVKGK